MKFPITCIKKYFTKKIDFTKIKKIFNNNGFETKNKINFKKILNNKYFIKIKIKNFIFNKNKKEIFIKILNKKKIKIIFKENDKKLLYNSKILIFKKDFKKSNKIYISKIKQKKNILILHRKKNFFIKKIIEKNSYLEINIPYNRKDCYNIIGLSREISILNNKKKFFKYSYIKTPKFNFSLTSKIPYKNYKYLIFKIKYKKKEISKYITSNFDNIVKKEKNFFINIINSIIIEYGQIIKIYNLNLFTKKKKINNISLLNKINKFLNKKKQKNLLKFKNTSNILLNKTLIIIAPLLKINLIEKINNKKNILYKYISNTDNNAQTLSIIKFIKIIKNIYSIKIKKKFLKREDIPNKKIKLHYSKVRKILGFKIKKKKIINILEKIYCLIIKKKKKKITIKIPEWRNDLFIEEDIIEEIIKIYGYNKIPEQPPSTQLHISNKTNIYHRNINNIKNILINKEYKEIINFHFSNKKKEKIILIKNKKQIKLKNSFSKKISILRTSLIPGLINTLKYNLKRQNNRIKIFEIGTCYYISKKKKIKQNIFMSAINYGYKFIEHWNLKNNRIFNFYDIKGDLEYLIKKNNNINIFNQKSSNIPFLEKKQNLRISINKKNIGFLGKLNFKIQNKLHIKYPIFLFEINLKKLLNIKKKKKDIFISKYPLNIRDITVIINKNISVNEILNQCISTNNSIYIESYIISIFSNNKLKLCNEKNITIRLIIQNNNKTLNEKEITKLINCLKEKLIKNFNARIN